jgi:hypothetical protein
MRKNAAPAPKKGSIFFSRASRAQAKVEKRKINRKTEEARRGKTDRTSDHDDP